MFDEFQELYHGSPVNNLVEFAANKFGKHGRAHGPGVYVASDPREVKYQMNKNSTPNYHLYKVQTPADKYLLNETNANMSFAKQTPYVQEKLRTLRDIAEGKPNPLRNGLWNKLLNKTENLDDLQSLLYRLEDMYGTSAKSLEGWLDRAGIPGNLHRAGQAGINRVIFNPVNAKIVKQLFSAPVDPFFTIPDMLKLQGAYPYNQQEIKELRERIY